MSKALELVTNLIELLEDKGKEAVFYKPCEEAGPPVPSKYESKGKTITVDDLSFYIVGGKNKDDNKEDDQNNKNIYNEYAIVLIYDIFGWTPTNRNVFRICDNLADNGFFVVMPNLFRDNPWPVDKMPPSNYGDEFNKWFSTVASYDPVKKDFQNIVFPYLKKEGIKKVFVFGLCWGGLMTVNLTTEAKAKEELTGGIGVHAARLTPQLMEKVQCPLALMPASNDGDFGNLKEVLDKKDFGKQCFYKYYKNQVHGFMGTRADWTDEKIKVDVDDVLKNVVLFAKQF